MRTNKTLRFLSVYIRKLPHITDKERFVLLKRLKSVTLEKIGFKFGVTEARIRQIEREAIKKVKRGLYQQKLFEK
jgi:DNA-directed RNA polymerase sigma subunit (sigma70/sigma32)